MSDLVEFLRAQNEGTRRAVTDGDLYDQPDWPVWVLAQCDVVNRVIDLHGPAEWFGEKLPAWCDSCGELGEGLGVAYPCETLKLHALPYADHPEYREEWRP